MTKANDDEDFNEEYYYELCIQIVHPTIDPAELTERFGIDPEGGWRIGEPRKTISGRPMKGVRLQNYWYFSQQFVRERRFFTGLLDRVEATFQPHGAFLAEFKATGGCVTVTAQLPGSINIGDEIAPDEIMRIAKLGIWLGIEVFPGLRRKGEEGE